MTWHPHNLTVDGGAPIAIDDPRSHVVDVPGAQPTQHIFYRALAGSEQPHEALIEPWWAGSNRPRWGNLFAQIAGEAALLSLPPFASHVEPDGTQHVFYEGSGIHIYELWWKGDEAAHAGDLMIASGEPLVGGTGLTSHVFQAEGAQHVFFNAIGQVDGEPVDHHVGEFCGEVLRLHISRISPSAAAPRHCHRARWRATSSMTSAPSTCSTSRAATSSSSRGAAGKTHSCAISPTAAAVSQSQR
jgi:hypothetical protein